MATKTATLTLTNDDVRFSVHTGGGHTITIDSGPTGDGPSPAELVPVAIAGCTAMDVISILRKKKQPVTSYRIHAKGHQREGNPAIFTSAEIVHEVHGDVDPAAIARAIELSAQKYCSVGGTLASGITAITHGYRLVRPDGTVTEATVVVEGPYERREELLAAREAASASA
jgi:putative redox protein